MKTLRFLSPYLRPYLARYVLGLICVPPAAFCALSIPRLIGDALNRLEEAPSRFEVILPMAAWILVYTAGRAGGLFCTRLLIIGASRRLEYDLRNRLYSHLLSLDRGFYQSARTGDLMSRATLDVEAARTVVGPAVLYSSNCAFMLALALPWMLSISPLLTLLTFIPLGLLSLSVRLIGPRVQAAHRRAQETLAEIGSFAQENFGGMRVVKAFTLEERSAQAFRELGEEYYRRSVASERISNWMGPIVNAVGEIAVVFLLLVGGWLSLRGSFTIGAFVAFSGYQAMLIWPMLSIGWVVNQVYRGVASIERLEQIFSSRPTVAGSGDRDADDRSGAPRVEIPSRFEGLIEIRGLGFSYGDRPILSGIDLRIPAGGKVALLGRTGSGKSTLVSLLPRLHAVPDGAIFLDGIDVNRIPLAVLRRAIGFVPQETFLFSRTVGENIAYGVWDGDGACPEDDIERFGFLASLSKDLDQLPRGYRELVGERGITLSGGQRQRVAIARALMTRPRVLILDDALAAVDTQTEEEILARLEGATAGMTVIVVSHRISSIKGVDRIYLLEGGRIVEEGTHQELLERSGAYTEIYRQQLLADELEGL